jgi:hypothetical protein
VSKEDFVMKLKDPLMAEAAELTKITESLVGSNRVETLPGKDLMYITVFMDNEPLVPEDGQRLEEAIEKATRYWHLEALNVTLYSEISMGFRAK